MWTPDRHTQMLLSVTLIFSLEMKDCLSYLFNFRLTKSKRTGEVQDKEDWRSTLIKCAVYTSGSSTEIPLTFTFTADALTF